MSTCHEQARYEFGAQMYSFRYPKISGLNLLSSLGDVWRPPADPVSKGGGVFESRVPPARCVLNPAAPVSKGGCCIREPAALGEVCFDSGGSCFQGGGVLLEMVALAESKY